MIVGDLGTYRVVDATGVGARWRVNVAIDWPTRSAGRCRLSVTDVVVERKN